MTSNKITKFTIIAIITIIRFSRIAGQSSPAAAPGPGTEDCISEVSTAIDCLSFIQIGSNLTVPEKPCCPEVKNLVRSHPECLCQLIGQASAFNVNITRALQLPGVCKVKIPSLSSCTASPTALPPGLAPGLTPVAPGSSSPSGLASSPTAGGGNNGASGGAVLSVFALTTALGAAILPIFFF